MFEFLEKIIKSEDIFPSIDIDFSKIEESILSFGDIFTTDTISNLESLSLFKIESIDDIPEKIMESEIDIPESQIQKIVEYLKTDPVIIEKITKGINLKDLIEIVKEKKELIFTEGEDFILNTTTENIVEKENIVFQKIKEYIPSEYFEKIISNNGENVIQSLKNDLTLQLEQVFENNAQYSNMNFENISNSYFQDIINNVESLNLKNSFFNELQNTQQNVNNNNVNNVVQNTESNQNNTEDITNIFNSITTFFENSIQDIKNSDTVNNINNVNTQDTENINNVNISNIQGSTYNESILQGSTYNEYLSTLNFNNINSEISNLYNEINKTNEIIATTDFNVNENTNVFDETIINSLTTKYMNKQNTEIIEVKEIINNLHEKVLETHHEVEILKTEKIKEPDIQKADANIQKADMKNNIKLNNTNKSNDNSQDIKMVHPIMQIPKPLPKFPYIGESFVY